jgi:DNA ligase-1
MSFKPMLAKDGDPATLTYPQILQPKLDGIRASVVNGRPVSRTLKDIPNAEIRATLSGPDFEGLDGELIVGDPTADDCYRRTASFVMSESKTGEPWAFYVFDLWNARVPSMPFRTRLEDLEDRVWMAASMPFRTRLADLEDRVSMASWNGLPVFLVDSYLVLSVDAVAEHEAQLIEAGHEGVILRDPDAAYKCGRSGKKGPLLKVKRFSDSEAEVIGFYEEMHNGNEAKTNELGRTERSSHQAGKVGKGTLGGLIVRDRYSGVEFRIGTGFDAQERASLWADRDDLPGRIVKYKFFAVGTKDKPRHPVSLGFRLAGDLPSPDEDQDS